VLKGLKLRGDPAIAGDDCHGKTTVKNRLAAGATGIVAGSCAMSHAFAFGQMEDKSRIPRLV